MVSLSRPETPCVRDWPRAMARAMKSLFALAVLAAAMAAARAGLSFLSGPPSAGVVRVFFYGEKGLTTGGTKETHSSTPR